MKKRAFSLIEILIVVFVFSVGILAIFLTVNNVVNRFHLKTDRFVATNLAIEGIEIVRNKRDNNLLDPDPERSWKDGLSDYFQEDIILLNNITFNRVIIVEDYILGSLKVTSSVVWSDKEAMQEETVVVRLFEH